MKKLSTVARVDVLAALDAERPARSHWGRAVQEDARDLVEGLECDEIPTNYKELCTLLLNGARDWAQWSWGGCGLVYDEEIAERYCTPSELARCRGGLRRPNSRESWINVQARAMSQATWHIYEIARDLAIVWEVA